MYAALWILFGAFVIDIVVRLRKVLNELNENVKIQNYRMDVLNDNIEEYRLREMLRNAYNDNDEEDEEDE